MILFRGNCSTEALTEALQGADAAEAMNNDGVNPDTAELFVVCEKLTMQLTAECSSFVSGIRLFV